MSISNKQQKSPKMSLVFQVIAFKVIGVNSPYYDENIHHLE